MKTQGPVHKSVVVPSVPNQLQTLAEQLLRDAQRCHLNPDESFALHLALEEALYNAAKHGNKLDPNKNVTVDFTVTCDKIDLTVTDQGEGFSPQEIPDCRMQENLYKFGGRGVLLMRSYMDVVEFNPKGNQIHLVKFRKQDKG
jgi:serine/threonine-protein kinase RsbW